MENNNFLTVKQVAELLQVHWQTVLNYIKGGKLEALRLGKGYRISKEALEKFVNENLAWNTLIPALKNYQFLSALPYFEAKYRDKSSYQGLLES